MASDEITSLRAGYVEKLSALYQVCVGKTWQNYSVHVGKATININKPSPNKSPNRWYKYKPFPEKWVVN